MPKSNQVAIYALTRTGLNLAFKLAEKLDGRVFAPARLAREHPKAAGFDSLSKQVRETFFSYPGHIFITAAGIAVRTIGPLLKGKHLDPAVVVMDQEGRRAVSLLSGHIGGANRLAGLAAGISGGEPVVTTATDTAGLPAVDLIGAERSLVPGNPDKIKEINRAVLEGVPVLIDDPDDLLGLCGPDSPWPGVFRPYGPDSPPDAPMVMVSPYVPAPEERGLVLHPPCLALGAGCRRGAAKGDILGFIRDLLDKKGLAVQSLTLAGTIEAKRDEPGLLAAFDELGLEPVFFTPEELNRVEVPNPSERVARLMNVRSVCEAAAILLARKRTPGGSELLIPKTKRGGITLALALIQGRPSKWSD